MRSSLGARCTAWLIALEWAAVVGVGEIDKGRLADGPAFEEAGRPGLELEASLHRFPRSAS